MNERIAINEDELHWEFVRSSGPGGQNVNKVSTAVQLRFHVLASPSLPEDVKVRLMRLAGGRITKEGELLIEAREYRYQERNRQEALRRLIQWILKAAFVPKIRRKTKPTASSREKRLEIKKHISQKKQTRGKIDEW